MTSDSPKLVDDAPRSEQSPLEGESSTQANADLGSSRFGARPNDRRTEQREPFYRQVVMSWPDIAVTAASVDKEIVAGDTKPEDRTNRIEEEKDKWFADRAKRGTYFSPNLMGSLEAQYYNATPSQLYGGGGGETRLFEVTPPPGTRYFEGAVARQGTPQAFHANLPGGGTQVYIPREEGQNRDDWLVRAVARDPEEKERLGKSCVIGYDENGDLRVTPQHAHRTDPIIRTHTPLDEDAFLQEDRTHPRLNPRGEHIRTVDSFAGNISEKMTALVPTNEFDVRDKGV